MVVGGLIWNSDFLDMPIESPHEKRECYRQNHRDRTNLCMLNFAGNKDWYGGGLSSPPAMPGTQFEMKIKPPSSGTVIILLFSWYQVPQIDTY
jgi:hypothetical protein